MNTITFNKRIIHRNPIEPYSWEAVYRPMGKLRQFGLDGYHYSTEIDRTRITSLVILGHPDSPIEIPVPEPDRIPDEVVIKAETTYTMRLGGERAGVRVRYFFGYRYGAEKYLVEIDEQGRLWKTNDEIAPSLRWRCGAY